MTIIIIIIAGKFVSAPFHCAQGVGRKSYKLQVDKALLPLKVQLAVVEKITLYPQPFSYP